MGVRGRRIVTDVTEPTLLGNIDSIIENARQSGFIVGNKVDIVSIIKDQGIEIRYEDLPSNKSGFLRKENSKWIIGVNRNHHVHRQRYTLAHEFAHYCLHKSESNSFEDEVFFRDDKQTSIEYATNLFAAKLLMPEDGIIKAIEDGNNTLSALAKMFDLSILAIKNRVLGLGYKIESDE
jgi:Zn-dependent peptidase ImmA (M78 family)